MSTSGRAPLPEEIRNGFHHLPVRVYYEDTDCTGVVYHSNYLKYFERSREHLLGPDSLVDLFESSGRSFVVTTVEVQYKKGARYGDELEVRTRPQATSKFRLEFDQQVWNRVTNEQVVAGTVQMVCVNKDLTLCALPTETIEALNVQYPPLPPVGSPKPKPRPKRRPKQKALKVIQPHAHQIEVYYEDTDFTGVVYYANYLKFMERARSQLAGIRQLATSAAAKELGFTSSLRVYRARLTYKSGARHGDIVEVRSRVEMESEYRAVFHQDVVRVEASSANGAEARATVLVSGVIELICFDEAKKMPTKFPASLLERFAAIAATD